MSTDRKNQDDIRPAAGEEAAALWQKNAAHLEAEGLYDPADEHASCGVGLVAAIDGVARREVVEAGIEALKAIWHRGAVDADGKTGDGAGIHVEIPQDFFKEHIERTGHSLDEGPIAGTGDPWSFGKADAVQREDAAEPALREPAERLNQEQADQPDRLLGTIPHGAMVPPRAFRRPSPSEA